MERDSFTKRDYFLSVFLLLLIGFIIGLIIQEGKFVELDNKIRYSELLNWLTTIFVGIFVGFILKNKSEKNKKISDYLCKDIEGIIELVQIIQIKTLISNTRKVRVFTSDERKEIEEDLHILDRKITLLVDFLEDCTLLKKSIRDSIRTTIVNCYIDYNNKITNDTFYYSTTNIEDEYINEIRDFSDHYQMELRKKLLIIMK